MLSAKAAGGRDQVALHTVLGIPGATVERRVRQGLQGKRINRMRVCACEGERVGEGRGQADAERETSLKEPGSQGSVSPQSDGRCCRLRGGRQLEPQGRGGRISWRLSLPGAHLKEGTLLSSRVH